MCRGISCGTVPEAPRARPASGWGPLTREAGGPLPTALTEPGSQGGGRARARGGGPLHHPHACWPLATRSPGGAGPPAPADASRHTGQSPPRGEPAVGRRGSGVTRGGCPPPPGASVVVPPGSSRPFPPQPPFTHPAHTTCPALLRARLLREVFPAVSAQRLEPSGQWLQRSRAPRTQNCLRLARMRTAVLRPVPKCPRRV